MPGRFNPQDYEDVAARIKRFKTDHPESRIITNALSDPNLKDWVVVRAEVFLTAADPLPAASGLAQEHPGQGANATSWWENAETSAIGRALANCGYSGDKRASREEMQKTERPAYQNGNGNQRGGSGYQNGNGSQRPPEQRQPVAAGEFSDREAPGR